MGNIKLKKLGVIGGMGPKATALYYDSVIEHTVADKDSDHLDMIILSKADIPDRTNAILTGDHEEVLSILMESAGLLERLGVDNIAMPCNTAHYYFDQVQASVNVPIINMVEESVSYAKKKYDNVKRIGIMATDGTIAAEVYHSECKKQGVTPVDLSESRQKDVMSLIYDDVKSGKTGDADKFNRVIAEFKEKSCDVVILACTELSVYKEYHGVPDFCLDSTDVIVRESILRSGAEYRE